MRDDFQRQQPTAADFGFPSPATDDLNITTPSLDQSLLAAATSFPRWPTGTIDESSASVAPEPDLVKHEDAVTPGLDLQPPLSFDAIVGADVDPAPSGLHLPPSLRAGPSLRLPSFASLGIAAPHSESIPQRHSDRDLMSGGDLSQALPRPSALDSAAASSDSSSADLREHSKSLQLVNSPSTRPVVSALHSPLHHYVTTLTPPDENGRITWESITKVATGPLNSPVMSATTDPELGASDPGDAPQPTVAPAVTINVTDPSAASSSAAPEIQSGGASDGDNDTSTSQTPHWLKPVIQAMMSNLNMTERNTPIKVLSHALPTPSVDGHLFPTIINSLQSEAPTSPMCWINVFHALPGKFNLADLPRSPPSTPGPPIGGDDYFTSKIFDSAVRVLDYQENLQTLPQSPSPIVPPSSVDISIVERYIPPSSVNEFSEMFSMQGRSILVDRLVELSPDNGTLIFIYPTRKGARTFTTEYLGPILEPLLRSIVVVNGFSADMGSSAGTMSAASSLPDHDILRMRVQGLCSTLSQTSPRMEKFHRQQATFSLVYAAKEDVKLDRSVWADDWWCKQEKPRLRETINRYFRKANRASEEKTPPMIIQELLEGVATNQYRNGAPTSGIEISIFVIKRSG